MKQIRIVSPGKDGKVLNEYGELEGPPSGWLFLPAGDAAITRKVTAKQKYWRVQIKKGRRTISKGVWAPKETIAEAKSAVKTLRNADDYGKKRASAARQREKKQENYRAEFLMAVKQFLNFNSEHSSLEKEMALQICDHAIPIGSGTVARTTMIPIEERAAKAVIAWMRHKTTAYDNLKIANIKGERRAIRRMYAAQSVKLLQKYRSGLPINNNCPLQKAMHKKDA